MKKDSKRPLGIVALLVAVVFFIVSIACIAQGFDKKNNYYNPEYSILSTNAYVGGDAYNYIINGTYFSGYCALGGAMMVCANISASFGMALLILKRKDSSEDFQNPTKLSSSMETQEQDANPIVDKKVELPKEGSPESTTD